MPIVNCASTPTPYSGLSNIEGVKGKRMTYRNPCYGGLWVNQHILKGTCGWSLHCPIAFPNPLLFTWLTLIVANYKPHRIGSGGVFLVGSTLSLVHSLCILRCQVHRQLLQSTQQALNNRSNFQVKPWIPPLGSRSRIPLALLGAMCLQKVV